MTVTEFLKLRTTRMPLIFLASMVALTVLGVVLTLVLAGEVEGVPALADEEGLRGLLAQAGGGTTFLVILGAMLITGEYRHGTITPTFLASPVRWRVLTSKAFAMLLAGALAAVILIGVVSVLVFPGLSIKGIDVVMPAGEIVGLFGGALLATAIIGVYGLGWGALIRNQIAAIVIVLLDQLVIEPLLVGFFPRYFRFLPAGAIQILSGTPLDPTLPVPVAALLLLAWSLLLLGLGIWMVERRDVS